jgi:hypothetical protein
VRRFFLGRSDAQQTPRTTEPLVIYAAREPDGYTYQLHPLSEDRVREKHPAQKTFPRIFISHDTRDDSADIVADQLVPLLTHLSPEEARALGGAEFRDPATDRVLFTWPRARS